MPPMMAASTYRLEFFSDAKIIINNETSKQFQIFNIKQRDAGLKSHVQFV